MRLITVDDCVHDAVYAKNCGDIARCSRGMSQSELARALGLQVKDIKDIEAGRATPAREIVEKMAALLDFPIRHFYRVPDVEDDWRELPTSLDF